MYDPNVSTPCISQVGHGASNFVVFDCKISKVQFESNQKVLRGFFHPARAITRVGLVIPP